MTRLVYTSSHDHMFVVNKLGEPSAVMGKQIVTLHFLMELLSDKSSVVMARGKFRNLLDEYFFKVKADPSHVIHAFALRLTLKGDSLFNGRGEFSNSIKSLVDRKLIEERKLVDNKQACYKYSLHKFVIKDYILYDASNTYRKNRKKSKDKAKVKEYNKEYHAAHKEELNRKKRLKYAINKLKVLENQKNRVDKHVEKVSKLRELARVKEESRRLSEIRKQEKEELRLAREAASVSESVVKTTKKDIKQSSSKKPSVSNKKSSKLTNKVLSSIDPSKIVTSSNATVNEKPVIMSASSTTTRNNKHYTPYQVSSKHKINEAFIHGGQRAVSPNAKTPPPKREIKPRYVTKEMRKKGNIYNVSPYELEGMIKDFINKGNKIKVYDQVSEDIKAIVQGPDRKYILGK